MGRLIDESLLQEKLALIPMEERTFRRTVEELENAPTVEAITKAEYEARLKADMVAMLEDLDLQIDESVACNLEVAKVQRLIRDKIDKLKENNKIDKRRS